MKIIDKENIEECKKCIEPDCDTCEIALMRWEIDESERLWNLRTLKIKAIHRLMDEVKEIDKQIAEYKEKG